MSKDLERKIQIKVNNAAALNEGKNKKQEEEANLPTGRGRTFTTLIRNIKYKLIIKLIMQMDGKSRDGSIMPN